MKNTNKVQYCVANVKPFKEIGNGLERHIDRCQIVNNNGENKPMPWYPDNADPEKTAMNRELIDPSTHEFSPHIIDKSAQRLNQLVDKRIKEAGVELRKSQNKCIETILSGSPETMQSMTKEEIHEWAKDCVGFLQKKYGKKNVVSCVLHMDETTPHIHAMIVPIVNGMSRRTAHKYKKEGKIVDPNYQGPPRLSVSDVVNQASLQILHTEYANQVGKKYGLSRGVPGPPGSTKKHQTSQEYNRQLTRKNMRLEADNRGLEEEKQRLEEERRKVLEQKQQLEDELRQLSEHQRSLDGANKSLKQEQLRFKTQNEAIRQEIQQQQEERSRLHSLNQALDKRMQDLQQEAIQIDDELQWFKDESRQLNEQCDSLRKTNNELQETHIRLTTQVDEQKQEIEKQKEVIRRYEEQIAQLSDIDDPGKIANFLESHRAKLIQQIIEELKEIYKAEVSLVKWRFLKDGQFYVNATIKKAGKIYNNNDIYLYRNGDIIRMIPDGNNYNKKLVRTSENIKKLLAEPSDLIKNAILMPAFKKTTTKQEVNKPAQPTMKMKR